MSSKKASVIERKQKNFLDATQRAEMIAIAGGTPGTDIHELAAMYDVSSSTVRHIVTDEGGVLIKANKTVGYLPGRAPQPEEAATPAPDFAQLHADLQTAMLAATRAAEPLGLRVIAVKA